MGMGFEDRFPTPMPDTVRGEASPMNSDALAEELVARVVAALSREKGFGALEILSDRTRTAVPHIGVRVLPDATAQLRAAGYNLVNKMYERSVDREAVATIRIGDVVDVRFDGDKGWWAWRWQCPPRSLDVVAW